MAARQDHTRDFDIVLFGATGFTGRLTAEYLARNAPPDCSWALAGRNPAKLAAVRRELQAVDPALHDLPLLTADVSDAASLAHVARSARVVITTVGPYLQYGEPLVAACARAGTDYVDLTGEAEFVDRMYLAHHDRAVSTGARIVHACGFDSVPYDLGALFTVHQLPGDVPIRLTGIIRAGGAFSGGTFHSAVTQMSRARQLRSVTAQRRAVEPRPEERRVRGVPGKPHHDKRTGLWLVPLPTIDPVIVVRSARALPDYGPDFTYSHYAGVRRLASVVAGGAAVAGVFGAAQVPPLRRLLLSRVPAGEGPDEARRERSWFRMRFLAEAGERRLETQVSGGDPGYTETAKMLAESALSLAFDDNPPVCGQTTTAVALGTNLVDRLVKAGITFTVLDDQA